MFMSFSYIVSALKSVGDKRSGLPRRIINVVFSRCSACPPIEGGHRLDTFSGTIETLSSIVMKDDVAKN